MAIVNTNFNSIFGAYQYNLASRGLTESLTKISSGKRVVSAEDDPASIRLISNLKLKESSYNVATNRNAAEVQDLLQISYDAISSIQDMLLEMQNLALRAANDATLSPADYATLNSQYQEYVDAIEDVTLETEYNNNKLLEGTYDPGKTLQGPGDYVQTIEIPDVNAQLFGGPPATDISSTSINNPANAAAAIPVIEASQQYIAGVQTLNGFQASSLAKAIEEAEGMRVNYASALSHVEDVDMASEIALFSKLQIISEASTAIMAQANSSARNVIDILGSLNNG